MDPKLKKPKGTAFVDFEVAAAASKAADAHSRAKCLSPLLPYLSLCCAPLFVLSQ